MKWNWNCDFFPEEFFFLFLNKSLHIPAYCYNAAYYRWCITRDYRTEFVEADMSSDELSVHEELNYSLLT